MGQQFNSIDSVELIDRIYRTVTGETDWADVCNAISEALPFSGVIMHGFDTSVNYVFMAHSGTWETSYIDSYQEYFHTLSPWVDGHVQRPAGSVYCATDLEPDLAKNHPEFYYDWARPAGRGAGAAVKLFESAAAYGVITLDYELQRSQLYDSGSRRLLETLSPHLCRAIDLKRRLLRTGHADKSFTDLARGHPTPVFIVDSQCRIDWMNVSAQAALAQSRGITQNARGQLRFTESRDNMQLKELVAGATQPCAVHSLAAPATIPVTLTTELQQPNFVSVTPFTGNVSASDQLVNRLLGQKRKALITIIYTSDRHLPAVECVQSSLGITQAEARTVLALANNLSVRAISAQYDISEHTVRTQLKSVFSKTGCRRQSELVQLITTLTRLL